MYTLELSREEVQALLQLIDAAVRAQGLAVAQNAFVLASKLDALTRAPAVSLVEAAS